jgi:hypothetical protein
MIEIPSCHFFFSFTHCNAAVCGLRRYDGVNLPSGSVLLPVLPLAVAHLPEGIQVSPHSHLRLWALCPRIYSKSAGARRKGCGINLKSIQDGFCACRGYVCLFKHAKAAATCCGVFTITKSHVTRSSPRRGLNLKLSQQPSQYCAAPVGSSLTGWHG